MSLSTIVFVVILLGATLGAKKPWMGGIAALIVGPSLFYFSISSKTIPLAIITLICFLIGIACGYVSSILLSGLKGRGHKAGTTYISGIGVHHPGGIILSNGERKVLKDKNIRREIVISYQSVVRFYFIRFYSLELFSKVEIIRYTQNLQNHNSSSQSQIKIAIYRGIRKLEKQSDRRIISSNISIIVELHILASKYQNFGCLIYWGFHTNFANQ